MKKSTVLFDRLLFLMVFVSLISAEAQVSSKLDLLRRLPGGAIELKLTGNVGTKYQIDASENFLTWFPLSLGVATNGIMTLRHDAASNYAALFYRGQAVVDLLPPLTVELRANSNTTLSAMASLTGSSALLIGSDGTRYTLTLPSNSIPDARIFTMTEVTNITALPFARQPIGTVKIEPADLVFWGAATLEISFRTNIDRRRISSFTCRSDGSGFRLTVDRVGTNRIVIPITKAGVYGSVVTTISELEKIAQHEIAPVPAQRSVLHIFAGAECQAAKKAAAQAAERQIGHALAVQGQALAVKIGIERQNQLLGAEEDASGVLEEVVEATCNFYQTEIAPRWPEGASSCAMGKVLTQFTLGLARQMSLLGADENCISIGNIPFCVMFSNCLDEIRECCDAGNRGAAKVAEVIGIVRQDSLLGLNCISESKAQEVIDACSSNIWTGTYSVEARAYTNSTVSDSFSTVVQIEDLASTFSGSVTESKESGSEATGYIVQLRVAGQITVNDFTSRSVDSAGECGGRFTLTSSQVLAAAPTEYMVSFSTRPDGSYVLFAFNRTDTTFGAPAIETDIELVITHSCDDGSDQVKNNTTTESSGVLGYSLPLFQGLWSDPNVIAGNQAISYLSSDLEKKLIEKWSFSRRKAP